MKKLNAMFLGAALSVGLFAGSVLGQTPATAPDSQTTTTTKKEHKTVTKTEATAMPTAQEISDAKTKGMVWVNTNSKVYHKDDSKYYGKTKHGKFMTESEAQQAGYHQAKEGMKKSTSTKPAQPATSGESAKK